MALLPFGNIVVTLDVNGAELKTMLENGVSASVASTGAPSPQGRFPQVSGFCFTYDVNLPSQSRVTGAFYLDATGACNPADPVDLTAGSTYRIAENDFTANGGDGYPNFSSRMTSQDIMEEVLADYVTANSETSPIAPKVLGGGAGRITCQDATPGAGPECPTKVPSP